MKFPDNWVKSSLGEISIIKTGKLDANAAVEGGNYPFFTCSEKSLKIDNYAFDTEAILLAGNGGFSVNWYIGKFNAYQRTYVIEPFHSYGRYIYRLVQFLIPIISSANRGSTIKYLRLGDIADTEVMLPPKEEQRRIADKLDTILTRVDALNDRLARITPLLKRFRQSVLATATSGRLTEDWSIATPYKTASLSELAEARLGKMLDKGKNTGEWVQYLRNVNVRWFAFDLDDLLEMKIEQSELANLSIKNGDVLICEGGEPGRCAVWKGGETHLVFQKALHRVRVDRSKLLPDWLAINLKHQADSSELDKLFTGSTIKHLTGSSLAKLEIPIPSVEEQTEIVRRVGILFDYADRLEARLQAARTAADRLTPALLAKAFRGELVPQDPNDEPATELLRRLREARAAEAPAKKTRGRKAAAA